VCFLSPAFLLWLQDKFTASCPPILLLPALTITFAVPAWLALTAPVSSLRRFALFLLVWMLMAAQLVGWFAWLARPLPKNILWTGGR
jgi:hypothetical protein